MSSITVTLSDDQLKQLREKAQKFGISPEDLALVGIKELLAKSGDAFERAVDYLLTKNAEMYRRLAQSDAADLL